MLWLLKLMGNSFDKSSLIYPSPHSDVSTYCSLCTYFHWLLPRSQSPPLPDKPANRFVQKVQTRNRRTRTSVLTRATASFRPARNATVFWVWECLWVHGKQFYGIIYNYSSNIYVVIIKRIGYSKHSIKYLVWIMCGPTGGIKVICILFKIFYFFLTHFKNILLQKNSGPVTTLN